VNPPPSLDVFKALMGSDVDSICFYRYEGHLVFENRNRLSFSAPFRFGERRSLSDAPVLKFPLLESSLNRLLGCQVTHVNCDTDGTLELRFSNDDVLIVYGNDPAYEAYTVLVGGKEYVV
jgi:hypothetical protein